MALEGQRGGKRGQEERPAPLYRASWSNDSQSFRFETDIESSLWKLSICEYHWRWNSVIDCTALQCTEPFIITPSHLDVLTLVLLNPDMSYLCNVDPDQLASALFAVKYLSLSQPSGSSILIG